MVNYKPGGENNPVLPYTINILMAGDYFFVDVSSVKVNGQPVKT
jgi:hypothetical protein